MTFASPALLWGLLLVPAAVAAYLLAQRRRGPYAVRFTNLDLLASLVPRAPGWRRHLPAVLYLGALAALLTALARPQAVLPVPREQATVVMVIDTSGSMAATDVQPSRMAAAQEAGGSFLDGLPAPFRVGIVSFNSTVQTLARPSTDRTAVRQALVRLRAEGGTAMGDAIVRAVELTQAATAADQAPPAPPASPASPVTPAPSEGDRPPAAILLLSDGANTSGAAQPLDAAARARELGIPVYTIALGTPAGTLPVPGSARGGRGQPVPPDPETLTRIADITGGQFFAAPTAADLQAVYRDIGSRIGYDNERQEVTVFFAAAGALLLVAGGALATRWLNRFP